MYCALFNEDMYFISISKLLTKYITRMLRVTLWKNKLKWSFWPFFLQCQKLTVGTSAQTQETLTCLLGNLFYFWSLLCYIDWLWKYVVKFTLGHEWKFVNIGTEHFQAVVNVYLVSNTTHVVFNTWIKIMVQL